MRAKHSSRFKPYVGGGEGGVSFLSQSPLISPEEEEEQLFTCGRAKLNPLHKKRYDVHISEKDCRDGKEKMHDIFSDASALILNKLDNGLLCRISENCRSFLHTLGTYFDV